jgi:hypothetical protein
MGASYNNTKHTHTHYIFGYLFAMLFQLFGRRIDLGNIPDDTPLDQIELSTGLLGLVLRKYIKMMRRYLFSERVSAYSLNRNRSSGFGYPRTMNAVRARRGQLPDPYLGRVVVDSVLHEHKIALGPPVHAEIALAKPPLCKIKQRGQKRVKRRAARHQHT